MLGETGVAGMRRTDGVKCLHAHLADYLGRSKANSRAVNPIGRAVAELLLRRGIDLLGECSPCRQGGSPPIDIGSNSVRLFVGEWQPKGATGESEERGGCGSQRGVAAAPHPSRARQYPPRSRDEGGGQLEPAAVEKTVAALENFAAKAAELGAAPAVGAATAAVTRRSHRRGTARADLGDDGPKRSYDHGRSRGRVGLSRCPQRIWRQGRRP